MSPEGAFDRQLAVAQERLKTLERLAAEAPDARTVALETLAELSTALEELNVLTEELREQNEELLATQQALEAERRRYLDLFDLAPDGYLVTDPDGRIQEANVAAARLLALDNQSSLVGRSMSVFVAQPEQAAFEAHLRRFKTEEAPPVDWQLLMQPLAGEPVPVSMTVGVTRDQAGQLRSLRWLMRDITERRRMEAQLRASQQELRALTAHLESIREKERAGTALAVHDEVGQNLAALNFDVQWMAGRLPRERTDLLEKISQMSALLRSTMESARRIFTGLHSAVLDDLGLPAALSWHTQEFGAQTGITCRFTSPLQTFELDRARSAALFGICQAILDHVARDAQATKVTIRLERQGAQLMLIVEDNGKEVDKGTLTAPESIELVRVREQAVALGGTISLVGRPGVGTTVTVAIPLAPAVHPSPTP